MCCTSDWPFLGSVQMTHGQQFRLSEIFSRPMIFSLVISLSGPLISRRFLLHAETADLPCPRDDAMVLSMLMICRHIPLLSWVSVLSGYRAPHPGSLGFGDYQRHSIRFQHRYDSCHYHLTSDQSSGCMSLGRTPDLQLTCQASIVCRNVYLIRTICSHGPLILFTYHQFYGSNVLWRLRMGLSPGMNGQIEVANINAYLTCMVCELASFSTHVQGKTVSTILHPWHANGSIISESNGERCFSKVADRAMNRASQEHSK